MRTSVLTRHRAITLPAVGKKPVMRSDVVPSSSFSNFTVTSFAVPKQAASSSFILVQRHDYCSNALVGGVASSSSNSTRNNDIRSGGKCWFSSEEKKNDTESITVTVQEPSVDKIKEEAKKSLR